MQRRTYRKIRQASDANYHHFVYVVLLSPDALRDRKMLRANTKRDSTKPCIYVGMTGLTPEKRFLNHKTGIKAARIVQRYGIKLLPEFYEHLNPMPFEAAAQMEQELAEDLRQQGYTVAGGT